MLLNIKILWLQKENKTLVSIVGATLSKPEINPAERLYDLMVASSKWRHKSLSRWKACYTFTLLYHYWIFVFFVWENSVEGFHRLCAIRELWPDNHWHPEILNYSATHTNTHKGDFPTTNHSHSNGRSRTSREMNYRDRNIWPMATSDTQLTSAGIRNMTDCNIKLCVQLLKFKYLG